MNIDDAIARSFGAFQAGRLDEAWAICSPLAASHADPRVALLAGQIELARGHAEAAVPYLERALAAAPANITVRTKLGFALLGARRYADAERVASIDPAWPLQRIVAFALHRQGHREDARARYEAIVAALPDDFESWNNLGLVRFELGDIDGASDAFEHALALHFDPGFAANLARVLGSAEDHTRRLALTENALERAPDHAGLRLQRALALAATGNFEAADGAFRKLLMEPSAEIVFEYGVFLERMNRRDALADLVQQAEQAKVDGGPVAYIRALLAWRDRRFSDGLEALQAVERSVPEAVVEKLRGDLADALGRTPEAFAAYSRMNMTDARHPMAIRARALDFPREVASMLEAFDRDKYKGEEDAFAERAPIFIFGFPRSGTTLLDTSLRNFASLAVLEEPPMLETIAKDARASDAAATLRQLYFDLAARHDPGIGARTIVDKHPLHSLRAPLIARLFPGAKCLFVERHPLDVVLSCFVTRFQHNKAMVCFQDLATTAKLYDLTMRFWNEVRAIVPLNVHVVGYEDMIADHKGTMRRVTDFLGLIPEEAPDDHLVAAERRLHVATASYAQVTRPIYDSARFRWHRYRKELADIMPIVGPWVDAMGYDGSG